MNANPYRFEQRTDCVRRRLRLLVILALSCTAGKLSEAAAFQQRSNETIVKPAVVGESPEPEPIDVSKFAADLDGSNGSWSLVDLRALTKLITEGRIATTDLARLTESLFRHCGWGGIARSRSWEVESLIVTIGQPALPFLKQRLQSHDSRERRVAVELLIKISPSDKALVPLLRPLLKDADPYVRRAAIDGCGVLGPLATELEGDLEWIAANAPTQFRRIRASVSLVKISVGAENRLQALAAFVNAESNEGSSSGFSDGANAASEIGKFGTAAISTEAQLREALKSHDTALRGSSAWALGEIGAKSPSTVTGLVELLKGDPNREVRRSCAASLGKIGPMAQDAIPVLKDILRSDDPAGWWVAVDALSQIGGAAVIPTLVEALESPDDGIRYSAVKELDRLNASSRLALEGLEKCLEKEPREYIRKAVFNALQQANPDEESR
ncbi:MAG TPA: HEAT repeat domain-containing protein [Planctomycetaceae bacterium]|nr:HEAT repeat domain-containing protein [Planctomycetaceae bacterium]